MKKYNDCMEVREDFSAYLDGEMTAEEREPLEAHLAICAECLREMDVLKRVDDAYRGLTPVGAPAGFEDGVREAVRTGRIPSAGGRGHVPRWMGPLVAMASAAAVLLVGILVLEWQQGDRSKMQMASAPAAEMEFKRDTGALLKSKESASPASEADSVGGAQDNSARPPARDDNAWEHFAQPAQSAASPAVGGREDSGDSLAQGLASSAVSADKDAARGGADEEMRARAELIGTPPSEPSAGGTVEKLLDAPGDQKAEAQQDGAAPPAPAQPGEIVTRQTLRSFRVLGGGLWVEDGYDHEPTTKLARGSHELRELMKKFPEAEWGKVLKRPARQVFQMGDVWYDLEAAAEEKP